MTLDVELRYWPLNKSIPEGWERHDGLDGTHHGEYAIFIVRAVSTNAETFTLSEQITLCECGQPLKEEQIHGHYVCMNCKTVTSGCCGDL